MLERFHNPNESAPSPEVQENMKRAVCRFFEDKLAGLEAEAQDSPIGYVQEFYKLCTGSDQPWVRAKELDLLDLPVPLRVRFDRSSGYQPDIQKMSISINPLDNARTVSDLRDATLSILESVYHEAEHIFLPGEPEEYGGIDTSDMTRFITYASKPSEINAFARQFAFRYSREYPNEPFEIKKMQVIAEHLKRTRAHAYFYFIHFAKPETQERYNLIADLAQLHDSIIVQTKTHLEKLKQTT